MKPHKRKKATSECSLVESVLHAVHCNLITAHHHALLRFHFHIAPHAESDMSVTGICTLWQAV